MSKSILTINSIKYTLNHLFNIANPKGNLEYDIDYSTEDNKVTVNFINSNEKFIFNIVPMDRWYRLIKNEREIKWIDQKDIDGLGDIGFNKIPLLFWKEDEDRIVEIKENHIVFHMDIISSSFFMLTRWEEITDNNKDIHGRSLAKNSVSYKQGFLNIPVVDMYGMILRNYLKLTFSNRDLGRNKFSLKLSHDIDEVRRFLGIKKTIMTILGRDLIINKSISFMIDSVKQLIKTIKNKENDPYIDGIKKIAEISKRFNIDSAFYFKTSDESIYDNSYEIDQSIKGVIKKLQKDGFEIGFHPGYEAFEDYKVFMKEKHRMDEVLGYSFYGGRHHYLRFRVPETWKFWEEAKLKYDSTLGYAEQVGFRCGTCHPFKPFDIEEDREINIVEIPLIVMDVTLIGYQNLAPSEGYKHILDLAEKCNKVEGVFTILWHNGIVFNEYKPWFDMYAEVIESISKVYLNSME